MAKTTSTQITKIGHGGDLHFFQNKRHEEYEELTNSLCELIVSEKLDLFYFGGDIVDSKTKLSPEQVRAIKRLIKRVTDLVPTVWILGNHDLNLKNKDRLDSLTPFLEDIETKYPVHFLKRSGVYNIFGINWAVWSCLDDQKSPFEVNPLKTLEPGPIIGCFHGAIEGAAADNDMYKMKGEITVEDFKDCDVAFLNDIHKRQSFRGGDIQYSGSWCQTKINEDESKGVLIWVWSDKKKKYEATYKELPKTFGYRTYEIQDLATFKLPDDNLPRTYIPRLLYTGNADSFSTTLFEGLKKQLQTKVDAEVVAQVKPFNTRKTIAIKQKGKVVDFFKTYFENLDYDEEQIEALKQVDEAYNKMVDLSDYESGQYEIEEITIHNFMSYGPNNVVNWASMPGVVGLFAPNRTGKSTLLDAIMFCHYNRTSRVAKPGKELLNDQLNQEAYVETKTIVNGSKWRVKRTLTPNKDKITTTLEVYETVNGKEVPRHKESRKDTEPVLRKMFGDAEIFLITALCTQKKPVEFVDCQNAERLDLFLRFLGITAYEQKHDLAKADLSSKQIECDGLRRELQGFEGEESVSAKIEALEADIASNQIVIKKQIKAIGANNKEIETLRELAEALQVVELGNTAEELEEELEKEELNLGRKEVLITKQTEELKVANEEWSLVVQNTKPEDWIEDFEPEEEVLAAIEKLRTKLGTLAIKESAKTIEQWQKEKDKIAEDIERLTLENLTFQTTIEAAMVEWKLNEDILEWEADTLEDLALNKKINVAESQIEHLTKELESEFCPTCKQKRVEFDKAAIEEQIEENKQIIAENKKAIEANKAERARLTNLQKTVIKSKAAMKLNDAEFQKLISQSDNIKTTIDELAKNAETKEKRDEILKEIETKKAVAEQIRMERGDIVSLQKKITQLVNSIEVLSTQIELGTNKVKEIKRDIKILATNKVNRDKRELLKTQIEDLNAQNSDLQEVKQNAEVVLISLEKDIKAHKDSLVAFAQKHKDLLKKEREYNYQQAYIKAMHRSGIPFLILQTYIPDINFEINDNLQGLFDFSVFFELDDKNLDIYFADNSIKSNKRDVSLTSGVEGFVINLAIRAALTRISLLPKPSIFMIDEGFSVSDADNLELLKELLIKFRSQYANIVMITHLDDLKDFPEHFITLQKKDGVTSILP